MKHFYLLLTALLVYSNTRSQSLIVAMNTGGPSAIVYGNGIVTDNNGNSFTTGYFTSTVDFDPGAGTYNLTCAGSVDLFISKTDINGDLVWAKRIGGSGYEEGLSITHDNTGNIYITGDFDQGSDFDPGPGIFNMTATGSSDIFILKLDGNGNFIWAKQIGGSSQDIANSIYADSGTDLFIGGSFNSTSVDFDPGTGTAVLTGSGSAAFILKLDSSGAYVLAKKFSGNNTAKVKTIRTDSLGNIYTTGYFSGTCDFDPSAATFNFTSAGSSDAFVSKLDSNGIHRWAVQVGGTSDEFGNSIAVDAIGTVYACGIFNSASADFNPGAPIVTLPYGGAGDAYVLSLDSAGVFRWAANAGSSSGDAANGIALDFKGSVVIAGSFSNTLDFNPQAATYNLSPAGGINVFAWKLSEAGLFLSAETIAGSGSDNPFAIDTDNSGRIFITGYFGSTANFDPAPGYVVNLTASGTLDQFTWVLGGCPLMGYVDDGTSPVYAGNAYAMKYNPGSAGNDTIGDVTIDFSTGYYYFHDLPEDNYLIKVVPDAGLFPSLVPTYYIKAFQWDSSNVYVHGCIATETQDMEVIQLLGGTGGATVSGFVYEGLNYGSRMFNPNDPDLPLAPGGPLKGIDVKLGKNPNGSGIQARTTTDINGYYEFINVPVGGYNIYVDIPNLPMDSIRHVDVLSNSDVITQQNYIGDSVNVYIGYAVGLIEDSRNADFLSAYPNPAKGTLYLNFKIDEQSVVSYDIINALGTTVKSGVSQNYLKGENTVSLSGDKLDLPAGVYLVRLQINSKTYTQRIVVQN